MNVNYYQWQQKIDGVWCYVEDSGTYITYKSQAQLILETFDLTENDRLIRITKEEAKLPHIWCYITNMAKVEEELRAIHIQTTVLANNESPPFESTP